jgi:ABC-type glycerol-3-phosphate transport system substrate-binding protein
MKRSRLVTGGLAAVALFALTACGGSEPADGRTTLTYLSWTAEPQMTPLIEAFEQAHPDIDVEASYAPPVAEYIQTLQTRVLSGTAPDVFMIAAENKTSLIDGQHVVDLSGEAFLDKIPEFNQETYGRDGKVYGMSVSSWAAGYLYNKDLLAQVGHDTVPETWDEFLQLCKDLEAAGITPFLESVDQMPTTVSAWVGAKSATMDPSLDEQIFSGESTFEEQWTPILEEYDRLYTEGLVSPDVVGLDGDMVRDEFAGGRVAMINAGPWVINPIREAAPDLEFGFAPVPAFPGGEPYLAGAATPGYAINAKADEEQQAAARKFLEFIATPEAMEIFEEQTNDVTVTSDFEPTPDEAFAPLVPAIREGELYLPMIAWQRSEDVLNVEAVAQVQRMIQGQVTPQQVAQALDTKLAAS